MQTAPTDTKLLTTIGLCRRAGKLVTGTDLVIEELRHRGTEPYVVIEASDTSDNTHKKLTDKCATYGVRHLRILSDGEALAHAVGKTGTLAAVGVRGELVRAVLAAAAES